MPIPVRYSFEQRFRVPARKAYLWCTNYTPEDPALMGEEKVTREIRVVTKEVMILVDTYFASAENATKQRLVCLYPNKLSWTSTHLTGPNKYSQFLYQIVPDEKTSCRLIFTGLHLEHRPKEDTSQGETERIARNLTRIDSVAWKKLAAEMERELKK